MIDADLVTYWSTPGAQGIAEYVWDTEVPEVTNEWPSMEPVSVREAMVMITGRPDVTGYLYTLEDMRALLVSGGPVV